MRGTEFLATRRTPPATRSLPSFEQIRRGVESILERWPDAVRVPEDRDRERLAVEFLARVERWNWADVSMARAAQAAIAVFDEERRARDAFEPLRAFFLRETEATAQAPFLDAMLTVYVTSFSPGAAHTLRLAAALSGRAASFGDRTRLLLRNIPELLDPAKAAAAVAGKMTGAVDPYDVIRRSGLGAPHGPGLMQQAHRAFVADIARHLASEPAQHQLFAWLAPSGQQPLQSGADLAINALLAPWRNRAPTEDMQGWITESVIAAYGDPRTSQGGIWPGIDPALREVLLRWLAKEDMRFFCDVVTATQNSHMWPPRRDFWLSLFAQKRIDEAWVAFGAEAKEYARRHLIRSGSTDVNRRFGAQLDRNGGTSLLIMRIGRKIVVDGCHSYKTHIFDQSDEKAPRLYGYRYHCDQIMRRSPRSKPHNSIPAWKDWVLRNI